ncbi:hypothetical protein GF358_02575 [Candidatus Woesearchaeota archaeon]|nr:hypothetical protein [Candidatus Woesearchaeota archaeon]
MKTRITPDREKAKSLLAMAKTTLQRLKETDKNKYPANTLTDYYDSLHKIMDAIASIEGIKFRGEGAHQKLIDYICQKYKQNESIRIFLQELRDYRNRIAYEGFSVTKEYIKTNSEKIEKIITTFKQLASF